MSRCLKGTVPGIPYLLSKASHSFSQPFDSVYIPLPNMYLRGCVLAAALAAVGKTSCLLSTASAGASVSVNGTASATISSPSATSTFSNGTSASTKNFEFFGVNESGPEFGTAIPGVLGTDYIWPYDSHLRSV